MSTESITIKPYFSNDYFNKRSSSPSSVIEFVCGPKVISEQVVSGVNTFDDTTTDNAGGSWSLSGTVWTYTLNLLSLTRSIPASVVGESSYPLHAIKIKKVSSANEFYLEDTSSYSKKISFNTSAKAGNVLSEGSEETPPNIEIVKDFYAFGWITTSCTGVASGICFEHGGSYDEIIAKTNTNVVLNGRTQQPRTLKITYNYQTSAVTSAVSTASTVSVTDLNVVLSAE